MLNVAISIRTHKPSFRCNRNPHETRAHL